MTHEEQSWWQTTLRGEEISEEPEVGIRRVWTTVALVGGVLLGWAIRSGWIR